MKLRFCAKGAALQPLPFFHPGVGDIPRYVGREYKLVGEKASFPATSEPFECDSDTDVGQKLMRLTARDDRDLWPFDRETAECCQAPFVELEFRDGEWLPKKAAGEAAPATAPATAPADETTEAEAPAAAKRRRS